MTLVGLLRQRAETQPDEPGLFCLEGEQWQSWSWAEYWRRARAAAVGLEAAGVRSGDSLLLLAPDVAEAVSVLMGAWSLGAVPTFVGPPYRVHDLARFVLRLESLAERLRARALIVSSSLCSFIAPESNASRAVPVVPAASLCAGDESLYRGNPDAATSPALVQLTSGSTGHPRGVVIGHERLERHMRAMSTALPVASRGDAVGVSWLPLHHDMGLIGGLLFPLYNGFEVHLQSPLAFRHDPFAWLELLSKTRAAITPGPPSAYALLLRLAARARERGLDLGRLECAMIGAEPISAELLRRFADAFSAAGFRREAFFPVYGLAEATVAVSFPELLAPTVFDVIDRTRLERDGVACSTTPGPRALELVSSGRPIPGSELRIVDAQGRPLPERHAGQILVRSDSLMLGYYDDPQATAEAIDAEGFLHTGDLGYLADGMLFVTGRKKELIIKAGHNLLPSALEEITATVDGVRPGSVAAVGVFTQAAETELVCIVAESKLAEAEHDRLRSRIREALREHGIFVDHVEIAAPGSLPKTTSGKVQRSAVKSELGSRLEAGRILPVTRNAGKS